MHIDSSIQLKIEELVKKFKENAYVEFEARFGTIENGKFVNGISRYLVDKYLNMIQSIQSIEKYDWQEHHDFYYKSENENLRSRVTYNTDTLEINKSTVKKKKIAQEIFRIGKLEDNLAIKFSISEEIPYNHMVPIVTNTEHVRIQQRRKFIYNKNWTYDFSMIWFGVTKTEAELQQKNEEAKYEFEIELNRSYLVNHDTSYTALSFIYKVLDFVDKKDLW